jgi:phosphoglycolate phosphatase
MPNSLRKIAVDLVVFDLDGTLADSLPDLTNAANYASRRLGLAEHTLAEVRGMIGGGERKLIERLVGPAHQDLVPDCLELYLDYYFRHCADLTRPYPEVPETLAQLNGKSLAVLSNKLQRLTEQVLQGLGLAHFFQVRRGGGAGLPLKPAAAPLTALMQELGATPERTLMVGDKLADINTARGAGTQVAAVTYGYGDREALQGAQPDFLLARFGQLVDIIE